MGSTRSRFTSKKEKTSKKLHKSIKISKGMIKMIYPTVMKVMTKTYPTLKKMLTKVRKIITLKTTT